MSRITAVATRKALSSGTLLAVGGGLALYQMTSLVLGPAGSRELHISLTLPAVSLNEPSVPMSSGVTLMLGTLAGPSASSVSAPRTAPHRAAGRTVVHLAAAVVPAPLTKTAPASPVTPVAPPAPTTHPSEQPVTPIAVPTDPRPVAPEHHDDD